VNRKSKIENGKWFKEGFAFFRRIEVRKERFRVLCVFAVNSH